MLLFGCVRVATSPPHPGGGEEEKGTKMQRVLPLWQLYSFQMFIFVPLGYQEEFVLTVLSSWLSRCQEVKFIFSIISGQTAQRKMIFEAKCWKFKFLCSLSRKSKEQKWKANILGSVFSLQEIFLRGERVEERGWALRTNSFGFKFRLGPLVPHQGLLDKFNSTNI